VLNFPDSGGTACTLRITAIRRLSRLDLAYQLTARAQAEASLQRPAINPRSERQHIPSLQPRPTRASEGPSWGERAPIWRAHEDIKISRRRATQPQGACKLSIVVLKCLVGLVVDGIYL